ncbi:uncharacterized protein TrAFT101_004242 [Trichoderma asperellum]|uniref:uncharacterized protein n=1 Tax=Trichoderma asperellum TaxID=101201 RepID=UPI0033256C6B|nr:hypothetical protein TrAFT101_004242 [Trichoderma asperellum]
MQNTARTYKIRAKNKRPRCAYIISNASAKIRHTSTARLPTPSLQAKAPSLRIRHLQSLCVTPAKHNHHYRHIQQRPQGSETQKAPPVGYLEALTLVCWHQRKPGSGSAVHLQL